MALRITKITMEMFDTPNLRWGYDVYMHFEDGSEWQAQIDLLGHPKSMEWEVRDVIWAALAREVGKQVDFKFGKRKWNNGTYIGT